MKSQSTSLVQAAIVVLTFFTSAWLYSHMPQYMATHWDAAGQVDGYMDKKWGLLILPFISLGLLILLKAIPLMDPLKKNITSFQKSFDSFITVVLIFLYYLNCLTLAWNSGIKFDMLQLLTPAFALLFYETGILMSHAKPNWSIGIRTPWTMSDHTVWNKTHKAGSILFKISAGVILAGGLAYPRMSVFWILAPSIATSVGLFAYSYMEYCRSR